MEHFWDLLFQLMKNGTNTLHVVLILPGWFLRTRENEQKHELIIRNQYEFICQNEDKIIML
jgi:hypothetical protein